MANTYTQIYIQVVFAVQGRQNLIRPERKEELHKYITTGCDPLHAPENGFTDKLSARRKFQWR